MSALPTISSLLEKLAAVGINLPPGRVTVDGYGDSEALSIELLALIRSGNKRAGTGLLWAYQRDGQVIPEQSDIEIVIDHLNEPVLVTRLTNVQVIPFSNVTSEYAAIEGEGDGSLEFWRSAHWAYFTRECARLGLEPSEEMPVICSTFELLNVVPTKSAA